MLERGIQFGLDYHETKERVFETVRNGRTSTKIQAVGRKVVYHKYFNDNLSFYVICKEREFEEFVSVLIKTIIIKTGRE